MLVGRLRRSDRQAFELIFDRYKEQLYFFTQGYLHSYADSEEIIQNVFLSLWESRDSLKEELSLKSFLYKITVNNIYNYLKHKAIENKYLEHVSNQEVKLDDNSEESIIFNDLKKTIDQLVEDLPSKQQLIFKLSRKEGLSHNEIAARLGLSVRSVENQIYKALKHIRERLKNEYQIAE
jgi:RNA polymerase sigma-70 factor (ECF subfamily)